MPRQISHKINCINSFSHQISPELHIGSSVLVISRIWLLCLVGSRSWRLTRPHSNFKRTLEPWQDTQAPSLKLMYEYRVRSIRRVHLGSCICRQYSVLTCCSCISQPEHMQGTSSTFWKCFLYDTHNTRMSIVQKGCKTLA